MQILIFGMNDEYFGIPFKPYCLNKGNLYKFCNIVNLSPVPTRKRDKKNSLLVRPQRITLQYKLPFIETCQAGKSNTCMTCVIIS